MKKIKYLTMAFAALFLSATFTACGDDDDDKPKSEQTENKGDKNENAGNNSGNENSGNDNEGKDVEYSDNRDYSKDTKEAVDLGLSVKWATCNVGASKPEEYGDYFAWGETTSKEVYNWDTYKYGSGYYELIKYCTNIYNGKDYFADNKNILEASDDAAAVNWGGAWRMPTLGEWEELLDKEKCTWTWQDDKKGYKVTGPNGNSIFLPAAGRRDGTELLNAGFFGPYWSSSLNTGSPYSVCYVGFNSGSYDWCSYSRYYGHSVRPVCK